MNYYLIISFFLVSYKISIVKFVINKLKILKWDIQFVRQKKAEITFISKPEEMKKIVSEKDIRNRAFEIYIEDIKSSSTELDNWFYAERELNGYYNLG